MWQPNERYPDPAVRVLDPSFAQYRLALASVERLYTGCRWAEGPVYFGDGRYLLWSDIPNNRVLRWDEESGAVSVFRKPSNNANGHTRDRRGRLIEDRLGDEPPEFGAGVALHRRLRELQAGGVNVDPELADLRENQTFVGNRLHAVVDHEDEGERQQQQTDETQQKSDHRIPSGRQSPAHRLPRRGCGFNPCSAAKSPHPLSSGPPIR